MCLGALAGEQLLYTLGLGLPRQNTDGTQVLRTAVWPLWTSLSFLNAGFSEIFPVGGSQTQTSWLWNLCKGTP